MVECSDITSRHYITEERLTFRSTPRATEDELAATAEVIRRALSAPWPAASAAVTAINSAPPTAADRDPGG
jgi:hypothetical protein